MKRIFLLTMFVFVLSLSSCEKEDTDPIIAKQGRQVAQFEDFDFRITLYSEKDVYTDTEELDIWGTLEYIGSEDSIDIYSGDPYMVYIVESDGVQFIGDLVLTLLMTTTIDKDVIYEFPLRKAGSFSQDDADADFWRDFYSEEKMLFPKGEYQLTFSTRFYTDDNADIDLSLNYQFDVN